MSARTAILDRLRRAEQTGHVPASQRTATPPVLASADADALLSRFLRELEALGVQAFVEPSDEAVRVRVAALVAGRSVLQWDPDRLPYAAGTLFPSAATGASPRAVQAAAEVGLTGVHAAVAETGTLAVLSGEGTPRAASLLPPTHVAVVRRADLHPSMGAFFASCADAIAGAACCTFITGPSRTADIELTLTLGVHGPGVVFVVVGP
jgi:L-lactate dehydrogenase complex protein LldG